MRIITRRGFRLMVNRDGVITRYQRPGERKWYIAADTDRVYEHGDGTTTTHDPDDPIWDVGCRCDACTHERGM